MIIKFFQIYFPIIKSRVFLVIILTFLLTFLNLSKPIILTGAVNLALEDLKLEKFEKKLVQDSNAKIQKIKNKIKFQIKQSLPSISDKIYFLIILILIISLTILLISYILELLTIKLRQLVLKTIRIDLLRNILKNDLISFNKNNIGDLISILHNDTKSLSQGCVSFFFRNFSALIFFIIFFLYLIYIQIWMTVFLILVFISHYLVNITLEKKYKKYTRLSLDKYGAFFSSLNQVFSNFRIIKIFNSEKFAESLVEKDIHESYKAEIKFEKTSALEIELRKFIDAIFEILVFSTCLWFIANSKLSLSSTVGYVYALKLTIAPARQLISAPLWYVSIKSSALKINEFFNYKTKISDGKEIPKNFINSLRFENVSFSYNDNEKKNVLEDITLDLKKNTITGIFGESGSGKSTFADLLIRTIDPAKGNIYYDKKNINQFIVNKYRSLFSVVPQENILINATIKENIEYGRSNISEKNLDDALIESNCIDFINNFPDGLNTIVGERGNLISGGQKQRICIARALIQKPEFLIFDEATSNLDQKNLEKILEIIKKIKSKHTIILISHENKCKNICDQIIYFENGKVKSK